MEEGSIVALVTPFTKDESIDEERLRFLINWHIRNKSDAILVCGTTGESATLTHKEHKEVIKIAVEEGDAEMIAKYAHTLKGVGANIAASRMKECAMELEILGRNNSLDKAKEKFEVLEKEFQRVSKHIQYQIGV